MTEWDVWFVMPAYNEAEVIASTIGELSSLTGKIVVVDDFSSDNTSAIALAAGAHVCRHPVNLGQGAALQTGIDYALARGAEVLVTFDADGQHRPDDARGMIDKLQAEGLDVVLASRFLGSALGIPTSRRLMLRLATLYTRLSTGLKLTDTHNGLRVFTADAARKIRLRQNRMAHASEVLDLIAEKELHCAEYPVTILYTDYSKAKGQRMSGAFTVLSDQLLQRFYR